MAEKHGETVIGLESKQRTVGLRLQENVLLFGPKVSAKRSSRSKRALKRCLEPRLSLKEV